MAVSGRKISDFHGSISRGSAEDFDQCCEPCLALGQHKEAHGLCVECQEYFCKNCYIYHQQIKATKHHQLLDKENMENNSVDLAVCTEEYHIHKNEIVKFFCTNHEALGCTDCITLNHRVCKIDYIPDKCAGIGDRDEYKETLRELDQKLNDIDAVIKKATLQDKEIDSSYDHVVTEIVKFRKEINDRLDQLQMKIQTDADKKMLNDKQTVKNVLDTCTAVSSDIKKFKSSLQDSKTSQQNGQLYIMIKQAKNKIKLDKLKTAQESLDQTSIKYTFQRNKELENLTKQDIFGNLNLPTTKVSLETKKEFDTLTHSGDINVRTNSDVTECSITGCAVLSNNKLVLVDKNNKKLKVLDMSSKAVTKEKTLDSVPWGIATVPPDHIAATIPKKKEIWLMETRKLKIICRIPVKGKCKESCRAEAKA
ncbi:transcription intermediary factor 1-alpha-like isoform X2 [Mercenaria mercenaria]|uniref:transcription intermediary factor 1-alpha-like isoform X2 n=1 Tax=Mercenaria mercenaria TaxID=6596 RepID=UPI00234E680E|nr:transcription intermediary factor 1-alpha-like isoform X2 [Mercenaria mercenaria]XP_053401909.1 transcription intermediary factor 1-alpha-like isoform X2 [Mercenaria mercenaria]